MKLRATGLLGLLVLVPLLFLAQTHDPELTPAPTPAPAPAATPAVRQAIRGGKDGTMAYCDPSTGEAILGHGGPEEEAVWWGTWGGDHNPLAAARDAATPNVITEIENRPGQGVTALAVHARLAGVAVEPSQSGDFELSYVGMSDPEAFPVTVEQKGGVLTVGVEGAEGQFYYVNTTGDRRCNTLRIGVPAGALDALALDCSTASVLVDGLDLPVDCDTTNAMVLVRDETRTQPLTMTCTNGSLALFGTTVSGDVDLSAANGSVRLEAATVTGRVSLTAANGSVKATADRLADAYLRAENGSVKASVGAVVGDVYAGVANGSLKFHLTRAPRDLSFHAKGWHMLEVLPAGWADGCVFGAGGPELELECANGAATFTVG